MSGKSILKWIKSSVEKLIDPEKEQRVATVLKTLRREIAQRKTEFNLEAAIAGKGFEAADVRTASIELYRSYLHRFWEDRELAEKESRTLTWLGGVLHIDAREIERNHQEFGMFAFESLLADAMADGRIDESESERLKSVARWLKTDVRSLVQKYFGENGEAFLQGVFIRAIEDGRLSEVEWINFQNSARRLGFSDTEALALISRHSERFVEHILLDAKSDERISESEERLLLDMLERFSPRPAFMKYVRDEVGFVRSLTRIAEGHLPSIAAPPNIGLRAGEIAHFHGPVQYEQTRFLKNGPEIRTYKGWGTITDDRFIFGSEERPFFFGLRSIISVECNSSQAMVQASGKGTGKYIFLKNGVLGTRILVCAVGKANQTIVSRHSEAPNRHIPRVVRQRVWQIYGGRCVDCGASDYLEYDHIIPVSRGGSNHENNIQLLCRACNLKKSNSI